MSTPHTREGKHSRLVYEALTRNGWTLFSDGPHEFQTSKRFTEQEWTKPSRYEGTPDLIVTVYYSREGYVTGYVSADGGGASIHGEGRHLGVWRDYFGPAACRDLLISNADDNSLSREDFIARLDRERSQ